MAFINPKTDFAFKKIFGSEQHKDILISFLNGILYEGESIVQHLDILNPYQAPRIRGVKETYLDVKARLQDGTTVIIEMQVLNVEGFEKRILYNAAKAYSIQLEGGQAYSRLNPVIALTITDFVMFADYERIISRFGLKEKEFLFDYPIYDLELVFVELPKFQRAVEELSSLTDKWLYFLQYARQLQVVPETLATVAAIQHAFEVANRANLTRAELDDLEHQEIFIQDQRGAITKATQQGIQQGEQNAQMTIAQRLLPLLEDQAIQSTTGLALETIQQLRRDEVGEG